MNKSILLSIQPKWVAKILNGEKTIEVRKKFPKDYVGWVYIYCTKSTKDYLWYAKYLETTPTRKPNLFNMHFNKKFVIRNTKSYLNGKVLARFWCDKIEEIEWWSNSRYDDGYFNEDGENITKRLCKKSCLTYEQLFEYVGGKDVGYALHISKLKVFDKPLELNELEYMRKYKNCDCCPYGVDEEDMHLCGTCKELKPLAKAPQNYEYIYEVKE